MRFFKVLTLTVLVSAFFNSCRDVRISEHKDWQSYFDKYGFKNACFILRDHTHESVHLLNKEKCLERKTPASTFKIFNSLVALETAVATDDQLTIKWDGVKRKDAWDKDMTMAEAFKVSSVPFYQEVARRIGAPAMNKYLDTMNYGNKRCGGKIDEFWLNDTLQISADEQVGFLKRMYFSQLPMAERTQRIVKTMMLQEETSKHKLYFKTGTAERNGKLLCWIVGFAERVEHPKELEGSMNKADFREYPYFFAMNFEADQDPTGANWIEQRKEILHQILHSYGAIVD